MLLDDLFAEAERQLNICNACRYCEGYCAVFPALERRSLLSAGDLTHLANLCHDCRACFHACMYADPHEFDVNPPAVLGAVRLATYDGYVAHPRVFSRLRGRTRVASATVLVAAAVALLVAAVGGLDVLWRRNSPAVSPYQVIPYPVMLAGVLAPCGWGVAVTLRAAARYWKDTHGPLRDLLNAAALARAVRYAASLRYLRAAGQECQYPASDPSPLRRRLHAATAYGFAACLASTMSAAFLQHIAGVEPPYRYLSVPVLLGAGGGVAMVVGATGLTVLKARGDTAASVAGMTARDLGLLAALNGLAITGLATLLDRTGPGFGLVLVIHLACVGVAFAIFPYTKFVHFVYRFLAIVRDNLESAAERTATR